MRFIMKINKYDYMSGELLQQYKSISEAAKDNNLTYVAVMKQLQQDILKYPRRDYYFGYKPKKRWVIKCYDNELWDLLGTYKNIKDASVATGVNAQHISWAVRKDLEFRNRIPGSTGLFFKREVIL